MSVGQRPQKETFSFPFRLCLLHECAGSFTEGLCDLSTETSPLYLPRNWENFSFRDSCSCLMTQCGNKNINREWLPSMSKFGQFFRCKTRKWKLCRLFTTNKTKLSNFLSYFPSFTQIILYAHDDLHSSLMRASKLSSRSFTRSLGSEHHYWWTMLIPDTALMDFRLH